MKICKLLFVTLIISVGELSAQVTLTYNNTYKMPLNSFRPEICINDSSEFYIIYEKMQLLGPVGSAKHWVHHYDSSWNKIDSFPVTFVTTQYGEPLDHRVMIINGEIVVVYQSAIWKDTSLWINNSNVPMDKNMINQSLMITRYSLNGTELFRGPIIANSTDTSVTFSDNSIQWNVTHLLVSTGTFPPAPVVTIREVNILDASILDTHNYNVNPTTIPSAFGNSMACKNNNIIVFGYTPSSTSADMTASNLDSNFNVLNVKTYHDTLNEQIYATGNLFYNNYYFVAHDERLRGGPSSLDDNPYSTYLKILDSQFNMINNIKVGDTGMYHAHPVVAVNNEKLYFGWIRKVNIGGHYASQVCIEEYLMTISSSLINVEKNDDYIKIFPNPATDRIYIKCAEKQDLKIQIYNLVGEIVLQRKFNNSTNKINIGSLPKGIYLIKINGDNWSTERKFVKE
ncbi:MAG: T9SS type A sorting domain-containing protein [Bacteroidales bacterium]|nr:T9SS type A sorting domain-containing protein [Bacteroidales bacterium]